MTSNSRIQGYHIVIDNGSSKPNKGSLKVAIVSDETGELLFSSGNVNDETLNEVCPEGFTCTLDYVYGFVTNIIKYVGLARNKINRLAPENRILTGIALLVPCQVVNNGTGIIANLVDKQGNKLTNVNWNLIIPKLRESGRISMLDENSFRFVVANDICGAAARIAQIMANNTSYDNRFGTGFYATVVMAGGGCGGAHIKVYDELIQIEAIEPGMTRSFTVNNHIEGYGASGYAILNNFAEALGLSKEGSLAIKYIGNARIATQYIVNLNKYSHESYLFRNSGLFDEIGNNDSLSSFKLKNITEEAHTKACKKAVDTFIDAIGQIAAIRVTDLINMFILTGPLAAAIKERLGIIKEYHNTRIEDLIWNRTKLYLNPNTVSTAESNGFQIICETNIPDNTVGGSLLLKSNVIGHGLRGSWFDIPIQEFKTSCTAFNADN